MAMNVNKVSHGQPMSLRERVHFLDIVRGFALMGIILVNYFLIVDSAKGFDMESNDVFHNVVNGLPRGNSLHCFPFYSGLVLCFLWIELLIRWTAQTSCLHSG